MDTLDQELLQLLTIDARSPATELAKKLGVSRGTIQNRIRQMLHRKIINRFTVEIGESDVDHQISAFALIKLSADDNQPTMRAIKKMNGIIDVHSLSGIYDYTVEIRISSLKGLDKILDDIRKLDDVAETQSHLRLASIN